MDQLSSFRTVVVKSPSRFAVIAPDLPSPKAIIASSDEISDLIGYYSIREAGLEDVLPDPRKFRRSAIFDILSPSLQPQGAPYLSFDMWVSEDEDSREKLYSLIIDSTGLPFITSEMMEKLEPRVVDQLDRVVKAYIKRREDEVTYLAQMLSTFISLLLKRLSIDEQRRQKSRSLVRVFMYGYVSVALAIGTIVYSLNFVKDSSGKTIIDVILGQ